MANNEKAEEEGPGENYGNDHDLNDGFHRLDLVRETASDR